MSQILEINTCIDTLTKNQEKIDHLLKFLRKSTIMETVIQSQDTDSRSTHSSDYETAIDSSEEDEDDQPNDPNTNNTSKKPSTNTEAQLNGTNNTGQSAMDSDENTDDFGSGDTDSDSDGSGSCTTDEDDDEDGDDDDENVESSPPAEHSPGLTKHSSDEDEATSSEEEIDTEEDDEAERPLKYQRLGGSFAEKVCTHSGPIESYDPPSTNSFSDDESNQKNQEIERLNQLIERLIQLVIIQEKYHRLIPDDSEDDKLKVGADKTRKRIKNKARLIKVGRNSMRDQYLKKNGDCQRKIAKLKKEANEFKNQCLGLKEKETVITTALEYTQIQLQELRDKMNADAPAENAQKKPIWADLMTNKYQRKSKNPFSCRKRKREDW